MNSKDIRQSFIDFFKDKKHTVIPSSSVAPLDDPTLLFTNAGMNQFKPIFLNEQEPKSSRVVNSQKCIRVSGKHNDLEEVGIDTFHHTFFEMLGNWSFGDYYKAEAIKWAWELFTKVWKLDKERLWATVYTDDDEAFELWKSETDIAHDRILRFGKKDNFWEMGDTGPCGPCSEIHYYIGEDLDKQTAKGVNSGDEYWELWNLVFIQYNRDEKGKLHDLPKKHIDTGAGFERIVSVMQNKVSNYETDLFQPIISHIEKLTGFDYKKDPVPHQVIADHARMLTFSIADGVMPSNEGRGYIVRRILRRASRFGRVLNQTEPFIYKLVDTVGEVLGEVYPEIIDRKAHIINVIKAEEKSFNKTLDRGLNHFDKVIASLKGDTISGKEAFKLYDTYGFPLDLTQLIAREKGFNVDGAGFKKEMEEQIKRAKSAGKFKVNKDKIKWETVSNEADSEFLGYEFLESESKIVKWSKLENDNYALVLDKTPFYAESGGQIGDTGTILGDGFDLIVSDTQKENESIVHFCKGDFEKGNVSNTLQCMVDRIRRDAIKRNHTATHLLHAALKQVLGEHVHQAGSSVGPDNFRFDLTHFEKITNEELQQVERIVNDEIIKNTDVLPDIKSFDDAKKEGAEALFGEKYGDVVRVLTIGEFSKELCGGTHVNRTGDIGLFKIIEESSLAAGVRRIVATTGQKAIQLVQEQSNIIYDMQDLLRTSASDVVERTESLLAQKKELESAIKKQKFAKGFQTKSLMTGAMRVGDRAIVLSLVDANSMDELKQMGDELLPILKSGIGVLGTKKGEKPQMVVVVTPDLVEKGVKAGKIAKQIGKKIGGGGGGRPHLATAGGQDFEQMKKAFDKISDIIREELEQVD